MGALGFGCYLKMLISGQPQQSAFALMTNEQYTDVHGQTDYSFTTSESFYMYSYSALDKITSLLFYLNIGAVDINNPQYLFGSNLDKEVDFTGNFIANGQAYPLNVAIKYTDIIYLASYNRYAVEIPIEIPFIAGYNYLSFSGVATVQNSSCQNIPDGQAQLCVIGRKSDGSAYAQKFPFNFSGGARRIEIDLSSMGSSGIGDYNGLVSLESFIIRASKGFSSGSITILERFSAPFGSFVQYPYIHNISVNSGQKEVRVTRPHYLVYLDTSAVLPLPISFAFKISLELDFEPLPECFSDVESETEEQTGSILDEIVITEPFQPPPDQPIIPDSPEYPPDILITDGGAGFSGGSGGSIDWQTILGIILDAIGGPSAPPEGMCECEKYLADVLAGRLNYLQKTLDTRLSQFITSEQITGRKLIEALQSLHLTIAAGIEQNKPENQAAALDEVLKKYFQTTEGEPRGIADVLVQKDCAPVQFIHVDTNSCYYRHLMPAPGDEVP